MGLASASDARDVLVWALVTGRDRTSPASASCLSRYRDLRTRAVPAGVVALRSNQQVGKHPIIQPFLLGYTLDVLR